MGAADAKLIETARINDLLARFQATGQETCFHGRHLSPQIYAGWTGTTGASKTTWRAVATAR